MPELLIIIAILSAFLSIVFFITGFVTLKKKRLFGVVASVTLALLMFSLAGLFGTIIIATQGYRALTREEVAAVVKTEPVGPSRFNAHFQFPDGRWATFNLSGDELYVDAHILKWKPLANFLGLHTSYELDRVAGRYLKLEDEQTKARTVFVLSQKKPMDMFNLRRQYTLFRPLLDAEYGSATFITAGEAAEFEVRVSTTGLLIRRVGVTANSSSKRREKVY
ncbi:MAG: hypothetical protein QME78_04850 [Thermodesulfobacteriota bacterium]|nr:hypothetical protein [Thermodesulfobacteriota bacterium]